jgi:hypothetical protein
VIRGRSEPLSESDERDRQVALDLVTNANEVVTGFARQMATVSLTAVGVVLTLADLRGLDEGAQRALAIVCAAYLVAAVLFGMALRPRRFPVSLDDYRGSQQEVLDAARRRHDLATAGFVLVILATLGAIILLTFF